jgi:hypothetical protein
MQTRCMRVIGPAVLVLAVSACGGEASDGSPSLVVGAWGDAAISTVCVTGEEDYGLSLNTVTPVQEGIAALFADGFVADDGCDATITVLVTGSASSRTYTIQSGDAPPRSELLYTGAEVQGTMSLTGVGRQPLTAPITGLRYPPSSFKGVAGLVAMPSSPDVAPYWEAVRPEVCAAMWDWFDATDPQVAGAVLGNLLITDEDTVANMKASGEIPAGAEGPYLALWCSS